MTSDRLKLLLLMLGIAAASNAAVLDVRVVDVNGEPVPNVAVFVPEQSADQSGSPAKVTASAVMDQRNTNFVPHILIVQKGTDVVFPNSDTIAHHVYSFSRPNNFVLPLYKGDPHEPVRFEHVGVVTLGCNIHDHMLAYILVVDTDVFGTTDIAGSVKLSVADGHDEYSVQIWSPRIRDDETRLRQSLSIDGEQNAGVTFALQAKLRAPYSEDTGSVSWSEY